MVKLFTRNNKIPEYSEIMDFKSIELLRKESLSKKINYLISCKNYKNLTKIWARILAAKPHNADVERLISANNILKNGLRNRLLVDNENQYLYIYFNMPTLINWDSSTAIKIWNKNKSRGEKDYPKRNHQPYFNGIFNLNEYSDEDSIKSENIEEDERKK